MSEQLIGYGYTNSQGVATLDYDANGNAISGSGYTGTGAGVLDLKAKLHDDGSVVSEPYPVIDGIVYDTCITGSTTVWVQNGDAGSNTLTGDGRVISGNSNGSGMFFIKNPSISGMYGWTDPCVIQFTVKEVTGAVRFQFYSTSTTSSYNYDFTNTGTYKLVYDGTNITVYLNGEQQGNPVARQLNNSRLGFIAENGESVKFTDFVIYPI